MSRKKKLVIPDHGDVVCCGCNCMDFRACARSSDGVEVEICQWSWVDRKAGVGLCSFCAQRLSNPTFPVPQEIRRLARIFRRLLTAAAVLDGRIRQMAIDSSKVRR